MAAGAGSERWERARLWTSRAVAAAALLAVGLYLGVALARIGHPFELEWVEGTMVDHVRRVLEGKPLYAPPTLEFVALLYPPLYYYASAPVAWLTGVGFLPLRLVSFAASLGCVALLFALVRRETGERFAALVAAGLFLASWERSGAFLDIARVDSLFLLLLLAAIHALRAAVGAGGFVAAGLLLAGAFLVKQSALVVAAPLVLYALRFGRRRDALAFVGTAALAMAGSWIALDLLHDGWLSYYGVTIPWHHPRQPAQLVGFWTRDVLGTMAVATAISAFGVVARLRRAGDGQRWLLPLAAAGLIGASWSVRAVKGAWLNDLIPAFAALSLLTGVALPELRRAVGALARERRPVAETALHALLLLQLAALAYDPFALVPSAADRAAGRELVQRIAALPGEVYIPHHGYLARLAGKPSHAHTVAMDNLFGADPGPVARALEDELARAIAQRRFAAIVLESDGRYRHRFAPHYAPAAPAFRRRDVFWPVTGARIRPETILRPR